MLQSTSLTYSHRSNPDRRAASTPIAWHWSCKPDNLSGIGDSSVWHRVRFRASFSELPIWTRWALLHRRITESLRAFSAGRRPGCPCTRMSLQGYNHRPTVRCRLHERGAIGRVISVSHPIAGRPWSCRLTRTLAGAHRGAVDVAKIPIPIGSHVGHSHILAVSFGILERRSPALASGEAPSIALCVQCVVQPGVKVDTVTI